MLIKKEKISSYLIYNIVSLSKMAGKKGTFFQEKQIEYELVAKYLETLVIEKICYYFEGF